MALKKSADSNIEVVNLRVSVGIVVVIGTL